MKNPFITHSFTKIIEGKYEKALALSSAKSTLNHLEDVGETICQSKGDDVRENVFFYKETKRAIEQLIDYLENPDSSVTDADYSIYYSYAFNRLSDAEKIIDTELPEYGF